MIHRSQASCTAATDAPEPSSRLSNADSLCIVEFDSRAAAPAHLRWRYTVRPEWSSRGESLWMRLAKFSYLNRMAVGEVARLFARQDDRPALSAVDLRHMDRWNVQAVASILELCDEDVQAAFCSPEPRTRARHGMSAFKELCYCKSCLQAGFHAAWFQWPHVERCPVHDARLRKGCVRCRASIPYALSSPLALSPLRCPSCLCEWVPALASYRGRCSPLLATQAALMHRWADCVHELTKVGSLIGHADHQHVRTVASAQRAATDRPHVLTMFNRLFDEPPPTVKAICAATCPEIDLALVRADTIVRLRRSQVLGYERRHWPHFGSDFAGHERLVRAAQSHLFVDCALAVEGARAQHLLTENLVAPATTMTCSTAAAVGWRVSWLGPSQALAPVVDVAMPALGLMAWLSRIPVQPPSMPARDWHAQVTQWLLADLVLSAHIWHRIAAFMSSRRHYLLHGDAVSPATLALRHHT